ncbi:DUF1232 domain-containing protein [Myxococcota bacterium]|nr:DUF1232 domain-containing protein [Myxococcota bacterium]
MNETELLQAMDLWVKNLAIDATVMRKTIDAEGTCREAKKYIIGGLAYLLRKVDIIPDYMGGIGVLDDASVMRIACKLALDEGVPNASDEFKQLATESELVKLALEEFFVQFENYVKNLPIEKIRNRNAETILDEPGSIDQFDRELEDETRGYRPKPLAQNTRTLRELKSFIKSKVR